MERILSDLNSVTPKGSEGAKKRYVEILAAVSRIKNGILCGQSKSPSETLSKLGITEKLIGKS